MMPPSSLEVSRAYWRRKREALGIPNSSRAHGEQSGLARRLKESSIRILILPADPFRTDLSFDDELWSWWGEDRPTPFGRPDGLTSQAPTADAAAKVRTYGDQWKTYLALHRHGGVEAGDGGIYGHSDGSKVFLLTRSVGLLWMALDAQAEALPHLQALAVAAGEVVSERSESEEGSSCRCPSGSGSSCRSGRRA